MCHKDRLVAALGTMSWPSSYRKECVRPRTRVHRPLDLDHTLAGTASFGSIRWPQLRTGDSADRSKCIVS